MPVQEHHEVRQDRIGIDAARADLPHQIHAHGITAEREERAVAKRENAGIAPDQVDRQRQQRVADIFAEQRHRIGRDVERRALRHEQIEQRHQHRECRQQRQEDTQAPRSSMRMSGNGADASCLHRPSPQREQPARALLDEQDDEHQDRDLGEHRAGKGLKELVGDAEREARRPACPRDCRRRRTPRP